MLDLPDRVSQDLRRHERQQRDAEIEARAARKADALEAIEAVRDPERLRRILDDEALAGPLAELCQALPGISQEIGKLKDERRAPAAELEDIEKAARAIAKIELQLVAWELGE